MPDALRLDDSPYQRWLGITLGMLFTAPLYHWYVPLVKETD